MGRNPVTITFIIDGTTSLIQSHTVTIQLVICCTEQCVFIEDFNVMDNDGNDVHEHHRWKMAVNEREHIQ